MFRNVITAQASVYAKTTKKPMNYSDLDNLPFVSEPITIENSWIDYNGHLNMAYYLVMFDRAFDAFHFALGTGPDYIKQRNMTLYTGQTKVDYLREVHQSARLTPTCQLLDFDEKRVHTWQELKHPDGWVAATCESLTLHIDMSGPRVTPFPDDILGKIKSLASHHTQLPRPQKAGQAIAIKRRTEAT